MKYFVFTSLLIISTSFQTLADTLKVAAGWSRPPYIIPETHSGFELKVVENILTKMGHKAEFIYAPFAHTIEMLKQKKVDLTLTLNSNLGVAPEYLSDVYVVYQNVAVSLEAKNLSIQKIEDLQSLRVLGFQGADSVLGPEFYSVVGKTPLYFEMANQQEQVELLFKGDVDTIILDLNVFNDVRFSFGTDSGMQKVSIHPIFPLNRYSVGFKSLQVKEEFNKALGQFVASGAYEKLKAASHIQHIIPIQY